MRLGALHHAPDCPSVRQERTRPIRFGGALPAKGADLWRPGADVEGLGLLRIEDLHERR